MDIQIRREELQKMYDGCKESIVDVMDAFLDSESEVLNELSVAFENENENLIRQQLHYHAPVFGYVGFSQVTLFLKEMENKYKKPTAKKEMKKDYAEVVDVIRQVTSLLLVEKELLKPVAHA